MGRTTQLRTSDVLQIMRLLADVAALKGAPATQRQVLVDGLNRIIGTNQGFFFVADGWGPNQEQRWVHRTLSSEADPLVLSYMSEFGATFPICADPFGAASVEDPSPVQVRTLHQVLPNINAQRSFGPFMDIVSSGSLTDGVVAFHRVAKEPSRIVGVGLHRLRVGGRLSARQVAMVRLANDEIRRMVEMGHLSLPPWALPTTTLSPRLQQVLNLLLAGEAPKRIAHRLGLSIWTIREYIQSIYTHFNVNGRDELMSKFVRPSELALPLERKID